MRNTDGSILSIGSSGSILSIGSAGSILSIGSAGSILSIGSVGSVASVLSIVWRRFGPIIVTNGARKQGLWVFTTIT